MRKMLWQLSWITPLAWIALSLLASNGILQWDRTRAQLEETRRWIDQFSKVYGRIPSHLGEVRALAYSQGSRLTPYDSYGIRLEYIPLTKTDYIIKSLGRDELDNNLTTAADLTISTAKDRRKVFIEQASFAESIPQFYQPAYLDGLISPKKRHIARLFIQPQIQTQKLVIQSISDKDFYMLSTHDKVEEFLWLPSGHELVFTASSSKRYEAGLFYWNLKNNTVRNLLPKIKTQLWPQLSDDQDIFIALSHISLDQGLLFIIASPDINQELDPSKFYSFQNLIALPLDNIATSTLAQKIPTDLAYSAFDYPIRQDRLIANSENTSTSQREWLSLSLKGDPESVIEIWQEFNSKYASSPFTGYGLWWLASIYNDAYRQLSRQNSNQAQVIRNFGVEISEALIKIPSAPQYLRSMARHLKRKLLQSQTASSRVSTLSEAP